VFFGLGFFKWWQIVKYFAFQWSVGKSLSYLIVGVSFAENRGSQLQSVYIPFSKPSAGFVDGLRG
jgi:hypothetical protein